MMYIDELEKQVADTCLARTCCDPHLLDRIEYELKDRMKEPKKDENRREKDE